MRSISLLIFAALALAACSGDDAGVLKPDGPTTADRTTQSSSEGTAAPGGDVTFPGASLGQVSVLEAEFDVGQTVTYAGFDIEVKDVLVGTDPAGVRVAQVNVTLMNHSNDSGPLNSLVELNSQGAVSPMTLDATPQVASGGTDIGFWSMRLDPAFSVGDSVLVIGRPDRTQASVPLGTAGELVTRAPRELAPVEPVSGTGATLKITRSELRYDFLSPRGQTAIGEALLVLDWELTSEAATSLSGRDLRLLLPSGREIEPTSATIVSVDAGDTVGDLNALFLIEDPPAGDYILRYSGRFGGGAVEVSFSIN